MRFLLLLAVLLIGASAGASRAQTAPDLLRIDRVDIGGRRLNLVCAGRGAPTVVFEQGWGETILDWKEVFGAVAGFTRTCVYDRAGHGYSDPSGRPATAANVADDLHRLLRRADVRGPVVLVGHSIGGRFATLYADLHPREVAGMVLVDPSFTGQNEFPQARDAAAAFAKTVDVLRACAAAARRGELSLADPHHCFSSHPPMSKAEIGYLLPAFIQPYRWEAMASELEQSNGPEDDREERAVSRSWGDLPLIVLTHGLTRLAPGEDEVAHKAWSDFLKQGHDALAGRSTRGQSRTVEGAGHNIQADQPAAVTAAIRQVVQDARAARR